VERRRSRYCEELVVLAWAIAKPIAELLPRIEQAALAAGVLNPQVWGLGRGVGNMV
jgi:hypothetical protein